MRVGSQVCTPTGGEQLPSYSRMVREPSAVNSRKVRDLPADIGIGEVNCQKVAATGEMLCYILVVIQKHGK